MNAKDNDQMESVLFFNWNLLDDGEHTAAATADGEEFGRTGVGATTLGDRGGEEVSVGR